MVDLVAAELCVAESGFILFAHADPHIGVKDIGAGAGTEHVGGNHDVPTRPVHEFGRWLELGGGGDAQGETEFGGGPNPRTGHVAVAIADEGDREAVQRTALFNDGEKITQNLARMLKVGECIDCADAAQGRELFDVALGVGADDRSLHHAAHDACRIGDGFAAAELDVVCRKKNRLPPKLADSDLETDARPGGGFGEHESPAFASQRGIGVRSAQALHLGRPGQDPVDLCRVEGFDIEQVLHGNFQAYPQVCIAANTGSAVSLPGHVTHADRRGHRGEFLPPHRTRRR